MLNVYFLYQFFSNLASASVLAAILLVTYLLGRYREQVGVGDSSSIALISIVGLWGALFVIKDPDTVRALNLFDWLNIQIIGISYIVFRCVSFILESQPGTRVSLAGLLAYSTFFPTILAGPIERFTSFSAQMEGGTPLEVDVLASCHRIANGMIKKFVLADNLAVFGIHAMQQSPDSFAVQMLWIGALGQLFLIYLDFSGYCDIVIGISRLMGIKIRENFNSPFRSKNIQEFWDRWHMSLSSFVKDYVFNPMLKKSFSMPVSIQPFLFMAIYFLTMILIALWHGTTMGFLVFGTLHGAALVFIQLKAKYFKSHRASPGALSTRLIDRLSMVLTYCFVSLSLTLWIVSGDQWMLIFGRMLGLQ